MAKKQREKKQPTLKKQISSKLSKLANKHLDHFEMQDLLRKVGEKSADSKLIDSLGSIFNTADEVPADTFNARVEDVLSKLKTLKKLIVLNISNTGSRKNFNTEEYIDDRKMVVDIEFKIHASNTIDKADLKVMNTLYKKHKQIKQLFD